MGTTLIVVQVIDLDNGKTTQGAVTEDVLARWILGETMPRQFANEHDFAGWLNANRAFLGEDGNEAWHSIHTVPGDVYDVALCTAVPVQVAQVDALAGYFFEGPFAGEYYGVTSPDAVDGWGRLFFISADFTKSRHDDWGFSIEGLWPHLQEGSPIRKTNRAGAGTKGTRAVEGLHCDLWAAFR